LLSAASSAFPPLIAGDQFSETSKIGAAGWEFSRLLRFFFRVGHDILVANGYKIIMDM
jgi:hypothetical protein